MISHLVDMAEQSRVDAQVEGVKLLFCNKYIESEEHFAKVSEFDAGSALGSAAVQFIRAIFSFEPDVIAEAKVRCKGTQVCIKANSERAKQAAPKKSWFGSSKETDEVLLARLEGEAVSGVTELLTAILKCLKMTAKGFVSGLVSIRRAFKVLAACSKEFEKWQEKGMQGVPAAQCIAGACNWGYGLLNVVLGSLPPSVLSVVGFLGMKADLSTGLAMLDMAYYSTSMYSPLAALAILNYRTVRILYAPCGDQSEAITHADAVLAEVLPAYPGSAMFEYFNARMHRAKSDLPAATATLQSIDTSTLPELASLIAWEQGWLQMLQLDWAAAAIHFIEFRDKSKWSRCMAQYVIGCCHFEAGDYKLCSEAFQNLEEISLTGPRKKASDLEKWAIRRADAYYANEAAGKPGSERMVMPGFELAHIWNCYGQHPPALPDVVATLGGEKAVAAAGLGAGGDAATTVPTTAGECLLLLLRASAARHSKDYASCITFADRIVAAKEAGVFKKSDEARIYPFALTEKGLAKLSQGQPGAAKVEFLAAKRFKASTYDFKNRLSSWLKDCIQECGDAGPADDEEVDVDADAEQRRKMEAMEAEAGITLHGDSDDDDSGDEGSSGGGGGGGGVPKVVAL